MKPKTCASSGHITNLKQSIWETSNIYGFELSFWRLAQPGNTNLGVKLSTVDLLIKVARFVKRENNIFNIKMSSGLYYKHLKIINDDSSVISK